MSTPKFIHDDVVKLIQTGQIGRVREVHQIGDGHVYGVQLRTDAGEHVSAPEAELELVKIANDDETGFAIRYIT
jgi:hypothetical protein